MAGLVDVAAEVSGGLPYGLIATGLQSEAARSARRTGRWAEQVHQARRDDEAYQAELVALGVNAHQYLSLREDLATTTERINELEALERRLPEWRNTEESARTQLSALYEARLRRRTHLLNEVARQSRSLRFDIRPQADWIGWVKDVRELLSLRVDSYIEDVRNLARWLWGGPADTLDDRLKAWRDALTTNDYADLAAKISLRPGWRTKLSRLDRAVRLRLCTLMAEDVVTMRFLRDGGNPEHAEDWQEVTHGSPGQRSAAMLSFVLHQGEEPLVLDQPEDDLDTTLVSQLIVTQLRKSRWRRQIIVVTHNANIPVLGDADRVIVMENTNNSIRVRCTSRPHVGSIDVAEVRQDIQNVMEGGVDAFVMRERKYHNELSSYRQDVQRLQSRHDR